MLRSNDSLRVVMIDFGLSVESGYVPVNVHPTGGQTHWSPEKAASIGYDFGADLWASVAVFVHLLSGSEPWLERYREAHCLHYIVSSVCQSVVFEPAHLVAHQRTQHSIVVRPTAVPAISTDIICRTIVQLCRTSGLELTATCCVKLRLSLYFQIQT